MNKHIFHPFASLLTLIQSSFYAHSLFAKNKSASYPVVLGHSQADFIYLGSLDRVKATIVRTQPGVYALLADQPLLFNAKHYQLLTACNLPRMLRLAGKPVVISGKFYYDSRSVGYQLLSQPLILDTIADQ